MNKNNLLLIIDPQNDFCRLDGALYVPNAEKDMERLSAFISQNRRAINHIIVSLDTHNVLDVSHPCFWRNDEHPYFQSNDCVPKPYTQISYADVVDKKWIPRYEKEKITEYLKQLDKQGEFPHLIWPEHCIVGSTGAAIVDVLMNELLIWARLVQNFKIVEKGLNPYTEHFGIFRANVPNNDSTTSENKELIHEISQYNRIIIAGEAKSHCVANSVKQLFAYPEIMEKIILLEDCMSDVTGFESIALPIYQQALKMGACFKQTNELSFEY